MTTSAIASRNTSEKARRGAMASNAAIAERKAAEEKQAKASQKGKTAHPGEVPPYCFATPGMNAEEAATEAVKALRISTPTDAISLLWQIRRVLLAEEGANAEPSSTNQPSLFKESEK